MLVTGISFKVRKLYTLRRAEQDLWQTQRKFMVGITGSLAWITLDDSFPADVGSSLGFSLHLDHLGKRWKKKMEKKRSQNHLGLINMGLEDVFC